MRRLSGKLPYLALVALGLALALAASACVKDNRTEEEVQCVETSDCKSGETCDEGLCYGNPPEGPFAAILKPSGESAPFLVETVLQRLDISPDGHITGLQFDEPVLIDGSVTLVCSEITDEFSIPCGAGAPIDALITVERAPAFPGGPRYTKTFEARGDIEDGQASFTLMLPPTLPDFDETVRPYRVTVTPIESSSSGGMTPAQIAPPLIDFDFLAMPGTQEVEWRLGEPATTKWIGGCLETGVQTVPNYAKDLPVAAFSFDEETGEQILVSSRGRTDSNGCYSLRVPSNLTTVNLRFEPDGEGPLGPTLEVVDELLEGQVLTANACFGGSPNNTLCLPPLRSPTLPSTLDISLPIRAQAGEGGSDGVAGADVQLFAVLDAVNDPARSNPLKATLEIRTTSSANTSPGQMGHAQAIVPAGVAFTVTVVPNADSEFAAKVETRAMTEPGVQAPVFLLRRVGASGVIVDENGEPVANANVIATPSLQFKLDQPPTLRSAVDALKASTETNEDGSFFMWLDGELDGGAREDIEYNFEIIPPFKKGPPIRINLVTPGDDGFDFGTVVLPDAAYARGPVTDSFGEPAVGVELHIWQPNAEDLCEPLNLPDGTCPAAGVKLGSWLSQEDGIVRVVLPNY